MNQNGNFDSEKCSKSDQKTPHVERSLDMNLELDSDVRAVAEFMTQNVRAERLVSVAFGLRELAPLLWGHFDSEQVKTLRLSVPPIVACD
jgi:hypothetical protein